MASGIAVWTRAGKSLFMLNLSRKNSPCLQWRSYNISSHTYCKDTAEPPDQETSNETPSIESAAEPPIIKPLTENNGDPEITASKPREKIGFIGLGNMGKNMAANLLQSDYDLVIHDVFPEASITLQKLGAIAASTPAEVAEQCTKIITMLPASAEVKDVFLGKHGIIEAVQKDSILIDSSTIDPSVSKDLYQIFLDKQAIYMDAPVSGGILAAKSATLTFMVGGPAQQFAIAEQLLEHMAKNVVHCGSVGTGQAAKVCNNMLLAISMIGTAETMNLGMRLGLSKSKLAEIINMSTGRCWSSEVYNPVPGVVEGVPSSNKYQGGFAAKLMAKDLGLAQNAATSTKSATPLGSLSHQTYRIMCNRGYGYLDFSSVFQYIREEDDSSPEVNSSDTHDVDS